MKMQSIKGTNDIISPEISKWRYVEKLARTLFESYGYEEIRTPIIEQTELFRKSIGTSTDIIKKEMFTFTDRGKRNITLRPEETASIARAYLQHKLDKKSQLVKLYYMGAMFRSERPQAGRLRQFHQLGVEAMGSYNPYLDVEIITLMDNIVKGIGLCNYKIKINALGCLKDRTHYRKKLKEKLKKEFKNLCPDCKERFKLNPLRILDCKNKECQKIINKLPHPIDYLCSECKKHFEKVKKVLGKINVSHEVDPLLVRGLDYYTKTVFELIHTGLGSQNALCAGGRYDDLVADFGGPETGACGFAFGIERLLLACEAEKIKFKDDKKPSVYMVTLGKEAYEKAFELARIIRANNIKVHLDYQDKSLKAQMRQANKLESKFVIIIGEDELKNNEVVLKDMQEHQQSKIEEKKIIAVLKERLF